MAYSSKWEMTILEIQTFCTYPPQYLSNTLQQTYALLCLISHCFTLLFIVKIL